MKLKKTNIKRLVSLSAAGAGALGVAAGTANAGIIYSGILDEKVGRGVGFGSQALISGPGGAGAVLGLSASFGCTLGICDELTGVALGARNGPHGTQFIFPINGASCCVKVAAFPLNATSGKPHPDRSNGARPVASSVCEGGVKPAPATPVRKRISVRPTPTSCSLFKVGIFRTPSTDGLKSMLAFLAMGADRM